MDAHPLGHCLVEAWLVFVPPQPGSGVIVQAIVTHRFGHRYPSFGPAQRNATAATRTAFSVWGGGEGGQRFVRSVGTGSE